MARRKYRRISGSTGPKGTKPKTERRGMCFYGPWAGRLLGQPYSWRQAIFPDLVAAGRTASSPPP